MKLFIVLSKVVVSGFMSTGLCPLPGKEEAEVDDWDRMGKLFIVVSKEVVSGFISMGLGPLPGEEEAEVDE